jgi:hypothetical protein
VTTSRADDLVAFLLAQLDEEEREIRRILEPGDPFDTFPISHQALHRMLADIEAKRSVIRLYQATSEMADNPSDATAQRAARLVQGVYADVLRMLALPYADQPGYKAKWKP